MTGGNGSAPEVDAAFGAWRDGDLLVLAPDAVLRLHEGCIAETGGLSLAHDIARTGFARAGEPAVA